MESAGSARDGRRQGEAPNRSLIERHSLVCVIQYVKIQGNFIRLSRHLATRVIFREECED